MRVLLAMAIALSTACGAPAGTARGDAAITVFAAASLKTALDEIDARVARPAGYTLRLTYAGTPALARQIEAGAPADVFIAADDRWMDHLQHAGHVQADSRVPLLGNTLVLVTSTATPARARLAARGSLREALGGGRLALADPENVPAGRYAHQALTHLGLWAEVADDLAPSENVRAALALVAGGEAPLGIVYASDAVDEPRVRVLDTFPAASHAPIHYPAALTTGAAPQGAAVLRLLGSADARAIFQRHGFEVPAS